jgi:hypothetical protein
VKLCDSLNIGFVGSGIMQKESRLKGFTVICLLMKCFKLDVKVSVAYMKADCVCEK